MSFSSTAKEELIRQTLNKNCCMLAELSAFTQTSGNLALTGGGGVRVSYQVESASLARRLFLLLKERLYLSPTVTYIRSTRLGGRHTSVVAVEGEDARTLLAALGMMARDEEGALYLCRTTPKLNVTRQCCRRAFLRAAWLGCGTMSAPEKSYHLEWVCSTEPLAQELLRQTQKAGLQAKCHERSGKQVVYLKGAQQVSDVLALMGASAAMMETENTRIRKQIRADTNRAGNCDEHNTEKMLNAAAEQARAIRVIVLEQGILSLPKTLQELARLRLAHTELSLTELGQLMEPLVSKSAINHRMRRLMEISAELQQEIAAREAAGKGEGGSLS